MQMIPLNRSQKRQLEKIYSHMKSGSEQCDSNCHKCCIEDVKPSYIEFAFLVDGLSEKEIESIFTKSRKLREDGNYYLCPFLNDSGKCSRYEHRPWVCRAYRKEPELNACVQQPLREINQKAAQEIIKLNNTLDIPPIFKDYTDLTEEMTIRDIFEILFKKEI